MKLRWALYLAILLVPAMGASTIDISKETSVVVRSGDTLAFHVYTWNFGVNATSFGLPTNPTDISFAFVSAPLSGAGGFTATLESADRRVSVAFSDPTFSRGNFQGSGFAGEVSTLQGYLHLSPSLSETLFTGGSAVIALHNEGPDVTVGLAPYLLRQGFYTSLSGGRLSVGATPGWVELVSEEKGIRVTNSRGAKSGEADSEVPEPRSGALLLGGGVLLCGLSTAGTRFPWARWKSRCPANNQPRIINHLHPLIHSDTI